MSQFVKYAQQYRRTLAGILDGLALEAMQRFAAVLDKARQSGHTAFVAGSGGSASTASHLATDLMGARAATGHLLSVWLKGTPLPAALEAS